MAARGGRPRESAEPSDRIVMYTRASYGDFLRHQKNIGRYLEERIDLDPAYQLWVKDHPDPNAHLKKKKTLSVVEAARLAMVDPTTIRRWCNAGALPHTKHRTGSKEAFSIERRDLEYLLTQMKGERYAATGAGESDTSPGSSAPRPGKARSKQGH